MRYILILIVPLFLAGAAAAGTVSIDLSDLDGDYAYAGLEPGSPPSRMMVFTFPPEVVSFGELRMVVSGTWSIGEFETLVEVGGVVHRDTMDFYAGLTLTLSTPAMGEDIFWAKVIPLGVVMDQWNDDFLICCPDRPIDSSLLVGAEVTAVLAVTSNVDPERVITDSQGILTGVRLDANQVVPVEARAWGEVKSLYR